MNNEVVITGRGLITPLGNGLKSNLAKLQSGETGIVLVPEWKEIGLKSHVAGIAEESPDCPLIDKKTSRFSSPNSKMAITAAYQALCEADIDPNHIGGMNSALILGCAGSAYEEIYDSAKKFYESGKLRKVSPFIVPRVMPSSATSNLSILLGIKGESYDISSACTSSAHAMMISARLIKSGAYDLVISGGSEELNWVHALGFNAIRALSRKYNDCPHRASRPFDRDRDGFVIAEGAGIVILESRQHAEKRGAEIIAELSGMAANSNGVDMVVPNADCSAKVMSSAIEDAGLKPEDIDYVNTHGTATPTGDPVEIQALKKLFSKKGPAVNSTKSQTGHMIGATGAVELIYCTQMMENNFLSPSVNLQNPEDVFEGVDFLFEKRKQKITHSLSNSFGFGGTNSSLVISRKQNL